MAFTIIRMQDDFIFSVSAATRDANTGVITPAVIQQPESLAVSVLPFQFVLPFVRVRTDPLNQIIPGNNDGAGQNVSFRFATAAVLLTPDESALSGARFVDLGTGSGGTLNNVSIPDTYNAGNPPALTLGKTYTTQPGGTDTGPRPITNPGALLLWKCVNTYTAAVRFRADIYLICRGPG